MDQTMLTNVVFIMTDNQDAQRGPDASCTIREFTNLARVLSETGYTCGLSGKWHLGDGLLPQEGFSYWFTKPKGHTHTFYHEFEYVRMIRNDRRKYSWRHPHGSDELYDKQAGPSKSRNLSDAAGSGPVVCDLRQRIAAFFTHYADPQYDIWRGGRSKAGRVK